MRTIFTTLFWVDAFERSIKTVAQTSVAAISASGVLNLLVLNWGDILSIAGLAGIVSLLTSIGSASAVGTDTASLVVDTKPLV